MPHVYGHDQSYDINPYKLYHSWVLINELKVGHSLKVLYQLGKIILQ